MNQFFATVIYVMANLFNTDDFCPRTSCGNWQPGEALVCQIADYVTALAYLAIPVVLVVVAWINQSSVIFSQRKTAFVFAAFIASCGIGHVIDGYSFDAALYHLRTVTVIVTACFSWVAVVVLGVLVFGLINRAKQVCEIQENAIGRLEAMADGESFIDCYSSDLKRIARDLKRVENLYHD